MNSTREGTERRSPKSSAGQNPLALLQQLFPGDTIVNVELLNNVGTPFAITPPSEGQYDVVYAVNGLSGDADVTRKWCKFIKRLARKAIYLEVCASAARPVSFWEQLLFESGFRKHPLIASLYPLSTGARDADWCILLLQPIPDELLQAYPIGLLRKEREKRADMLRESGPSADVRLARYQLAAEHARGSRVILDCACGLGYGTAMLAYQCPDARVIGVDTSETAIQYARANYSDGLANLEFHVADPGAWQFLDGITLDLVISFDKIEYLMDPTAVLSGIAARMSPEGKFIGSVANGRNYDTAKHPHPPHRQGFDLPKFFRLLSEAFAVSAVYQQNAAAEVGHSAALPRLEQLQLPVTDRHLKAEWWILVARPRVPYVAVGDIPRVWLVDGLKRGHFYETLRRDVQAEWLTSPDEMPPRIDLAIVSDEWWWKSSLAVQQAKRSHVPTLHLMDGIVDWKNTWENPRSLSGKNGTPLFQPVLCDKIACLGPLQARLLSSWSNAGKTEVTGMPRFDRYYGMCKRTHSGNEPPRILVVTANTPGFTDEHRAAVVCALSDVKDVFQRSSAEDRPIQAVWRLTGGLERELGISQNCLDDPARNIAETLATVDAVISTPSTVMLEAMLLGLPVAVLDYSNVPHYIQPAWRITALQHLAPVVTELVNPPASKMLYQETVLHDALSCASPAAPRLATLVADMIKIGRQARARGQPPEFPAEMTSRTTGALRVENRYVMQTLYPDHPVFEIETLQELRVELNHWRNSVGQEPAAAIAYALDTIAWRSKLEAGVALLQCGSRTDALKMMLAGIKAVERCKDARAVLDGLVEICSKLHILDPNRAVYLLGLARTLAQQQQRAEELQRIDSLLRGIHQCSAARAMPGSPSR